MSGEGKMEKDKLMIGKTEDIGRVAERGVWHGKAAQQRGYGKKKGWMDRRGGVGRK